MNNMKETSWCELASNNPQSIGGYFDDNIMNVAGRSLFQKVLGAATDTLYKIERDGQIAFDKNDPQRIRFHLKLEELGGRLLLQYIGDDRSSLYVWPDGIAYISYSASDYLSLQICSQQKELVETLNKLCDELILPVERDGHIYAIVRNGTHLLLNSIGNAAIPLEEGNYSQKVVDDFNYIIKDLKSESPSGRISIMEGEPGTGKTHLVRALLEEVQDAMFVLVSPEMVSQLGGPELLPLLMSHKHNVDFNGPIVLVLEDADRCLVTRGSDNINSIQSLLNLGDGILGSLLDLRIIATTNAKKLEMEAAILRPGRLSKRLDVGPLDGERAKKAFQRLCPEGMIPDKITIAISDNKKITLAEVYSLARQAGWEPKSRQIETAKKSVLNSPEKDCSDW